METQSQFDIEKKIAKWIERFGNSETVRPENAREMESHLRDAVSELVGKGLSEQEAFSVATHRLGDAKALHQEFGKVNGGDIWRKRLIWMLGGYFLISLIFKFSDAVSSFSAIFVARVFPLSGSSLGYTKLAVEFACLILLFVGSLLLLSCGNHVYLKKRDNQSPRHDAVSRSRTTYLWIGLIILFFFVKIASVAAQVVFARRMTPSLLGEYLQVQFLGNGAILITFQLALIVLLMLLLKTKYRDSEFLRSQTP